MLSQFLFMNKQAMLQPTARKRLVTPIHKKIRGEFSFSFSRTKKKATKEIPETKRASGHENFGSMSWSLIELGFSGG